MSFLPCYDTISLYMPLSFCSCFDRGAKCDIMLQLHVQLSFALNRNCNRHPLLPRLALLGGRAAWLRNCPLPSMSSTATASNWKPGDPILFSSPATVSTRSASSSSHTARQPLVAMSKAKQARVAADKDTVRPKQHQSTLSPWAKAAWKPGMRVCIETTARQSTQRLIEADSNRPAHDRKGKQRMIESSCDVDER